MTLLSRVQIVAKVQAERVETLVAGAGKQQKRAERCGLVITPPILWSVYDKTCCAQDWLAWVLPTLALPFQTLVGRWEFLQLQMRKASSPKLSGASNGSFWYSVSMQTC